MSDELDIVRDLAQSASELAQDAMLAAEGAEARVSELRDDLYEALRNVREVTDCLEDALTVYIREAPNGPFAARESAMAVLRGE